MREQSAYTQAKQEGQPVGKAVTKVEPEQRNLPALLSELPPMHMMAGMQAMMSAPGRHLDDDRVKSLMATGAVDLYKQFGAEDAAEAILSMLTVGVTSVSLDCLAQAASISPEYLEARDLNLRHGFKGAAVAAELLKALGARRGNSVPRNVTVRDVNVEAGAQAIIGNVEAPRRKDGRELRGAEPVAQVDKPELEEDN
jgi:hypothetical protein